MGKSKVLVVFVAQGHKSWVDQSSSLLIPVLLINTAAAFMDVATYTIKAIDDLNYYRLDLYDYFSTRVALQTLK